MLEQSLDEVEDRVKDFEGHTIEEVKRKDGRITIGLDNDEMVYLFEDEQHWEIGRQIKL